MILLGAGIAWALAALLACYASESAPFFLAAGALIALFLNGLHAGE